MGGVGGCLGGTRDGRGREGFEGTHKLGVGEGLGDTRDGSRLQGRQWMGELGKT